VRAVARLLRLQGYAVTSAVSGDQAIHLVENGLVPDLILTDYRLEVLNEIRRLLGTLS
jgi:CheY-like chemotaxis protein